MESRTNLCRPAFIIRNNEGHPKAIYGMRMPMTWFTSGLSLDEFSSDKQRKKNLSLCCFISTSLFSFFVFGNKRVHTSMEQKFRQINEAVCLLLISYSVVSNFEPLDGRSFPLGKVCIRARLKFEIVIFCVLVLAQSSNQSQILGNTRQTCKCFQHFTF